MSEQAPNKAGNDGGSVTVGLPEESRDAYNDGYTHEALHTTHVLMETFADHVLDTSCADQFPDVKEQAERVHQAMFDLYQLIGMKFEGT